MLKVRVAEMQRQIAKQFGVNLSAAAIGGRCADRSCPPPIPTA